ncbi:hypothetical protein BJ546DRAFT_1064374 [Cryomyces antarcticus]|uniref:GST N-terminal domain-containing protein n=1 Tax=Cryomyces antarcticus TaxID=329879 RepID=A0ABR0M7I3_9PEZI|nr:hypothetical protein LTR39_001519 [Cryomyces antarcticus]KAK5018323.1 hypothetical protein LTR60_001546 [Cryomyces antarcticus]KAK5291072.1 hypothetical protein LTR16_002345 [Cryomyces antarcticus]
MAATQKPILYSSVVSQWANVPHLGLVELGYGKDEVEIREIDLFKAENFDPEYLKINPNGTVPAMIAPSQSTPLADTRPILQYLDQARSSKDVPTLTPSDAQVKALADSLIELVHSGDLNTDLILLQARNKEELENKKKSPFATFLSSRQQALEAYRTAYPDHPFYGPKAEANGSIHHVYATGTNPEQEAFFESTQAAYRRFIAGMETLESSLRLPYAAGDNVTLADLHIVPWLSHAQWGVGTTDTTDLDTLEAHLQKTAPDFRIGPNTREWWRNFGKRDSFKQVFPTVH